MQPTKGKQGTKGQKQILEENKSTLQFYLYVISGVNVSIVNGRNRNSNLVTCTCMYPSNNFQVLKKLIYLEICYFQSSETKWWIINNLLSTYFNAHYAHYHQYYTGNKCT